ncbi:MAG: stage V sporulation protein AE [Clostridia bacterium]|nr:stage V sporulation protein AE [Clostridia bacterium]
MDYLLAFAFGGFLCAVAQLVVDSTRLSPAHVLVGFVVAGALASGLGLYEPLVELFGAGATVPLPGFGHALAQGAIRETAEHGWVGVFTGGLAATAMGLTAAVVFGALAALAFRPKA